VLAAAGILLGLVLGLAGGGRLAGLTTISLRWEYALLALFAVQALARGVLPVFIGPLAIALWAACSLALLFAVVLQLRRGRGLALAASGVAMNLLVILVNSGMPVVPREWEMNAAARAAHASGGFYHIADVRTVFPALADTLPSGVGLASLGDLLLALGIATLVASHMIDSVAEAHLRGVSST